MQITWNQCVCCAVAEVQKCYSMKVNAIEALNVRHRHFGFRPSIPFICSSFHTWFTFDFNTFYWHRANRSSKFNATKWNFRFHINCAQHECVMATENCAPITNLGWYVPKMTADPLCLFRGVTLFDQKQSDATLFVWQHRCTLGCYHCHHAK